MKDEIKAILTSMHYAGHTFASYRMKSVDILKLLDYITNLQTIEQQYSAILSENAELENKITNLQEENERLKKIAHKMHLWIFLNSGDEQKVYDELGLTDEENAMLGYSGQFRLQGEDKDE